MNVLARSADGLWEIHEVRDDSLLDTHHGVTWSVVHLPSGDTTATFGWTEARESGTSVRHGDKEIRFAGSAVEIVREDGRVDRVDLVWPVPPAKTPADAQMPDGWAEYEKRLMDEYREKLASKEKLEASWRASRRT